MGNVDDHSFISFGITYTIITLFVYKIELLRREWIIVSYSHAMPIYELIPMLIIVCSYLLLYVVWLSLLS